jgi:hypothetical protein
LPFSDAVIIAVPAVIAASANEALDEPAWMVTGVCTVAIEGLLLDNETLAPPVGAAAVRLTVPCPLLPAARLVAFSATLETAGVVVVVVVAPVGEPLHRIMATVATAIVASAASGVVRGLILKEPSPG